MTPQRSTIIIAGDQKAEQVHKAIVPSIGQHGPSA